MKIDELISLLQEIRGVHGSHLRVVIPVYREFSIGSTPCVDIDSVYRGIDWNNGKVFICPTDKLEVLNEWKLT